MFYKETWMLFRWTIAAGVALVLASPLIATDALARQKGQKNLATKSGKKTTAGSQAPAVQTGSTTWSNPSVPKTTPNANTDFGFGGPYIGLKYKRDVD